MSPGSCGSLRAFLAKVEKVVVQYEEYYAASGCGLCNASEKQIQKLLERDASQADRAGAQRCIPLCCSGSLVPDRTHKAATS